MKASRGAAKKFLCSEKSVFLGVHSLSLERETGTGVFANFSRELEHLQRESGKFKRESAKFKRKMAVFKPIIPGFGQLCPGNRRNQFTILWSLGAIPVGGDFSYPITCFQTAGGKKDRKIPVQALLDGVPATGLQLLR